ncbi:hypothetical protein CVT24_010901 [Panaeolus cyanescens]|uniref:Required for respiratory growth protein 9, mitochondrial n=1 Tax=Panaeolus cyanescens TaxID=181874 RepID=A0A409WAQ7_9AGAR|nr:hypothetical protein CVT24_010901 [Panaeolus cyanescens]
MASFLRSISSNSRSSLSSFRFYSAVSANATQKWSLQGVPKPRSILDDDDSPVDLSEDNDAVDGRYRDGLPAHDRRPSGKPTPHEYKAHRETIKKEFPSGWAPPRKLSREAMDAVRQLNSMDPEKFSTPMLADKFKISPEAVRRILKSKWEPSAERRTAMAVKERKQRQLVTLERKKKEELEQRELLELKRFSRPLKRDRHSAATDVDPNDSQPRGVNRQDRLSFV